MIKASGFPIIGLFLNLFLTLNLIPFINLINCHISTLYCQILFFNAMFKCSITEQLISSGFKFFAITHSLMMFKEVKAFVNIISRILNIFVLTIICDSRIFYCFLSFSAYSFHMRTIDCHYLNMSFFLFIIISHYLGRNKCISFINKSIMLGLFYDKNSDDISIEFMIKFLVYHLNEGVKRAFFCDKFNKKYGRSYVSKCLEFRNISGGDTIYSEFTTGSINVQGSFCITASVLSKDFVKVSIADITASQTVVFNNCTLLRYNLELLFNHASKYGELLILKNRCHVLDQDEIFSMLSSKVLQTVTIESFLTLLGDLELDYIAHLSMLNKGFLMLISDYLKEYYKEDKLDDFSNVLISRVRLFKPLNLNNKDYKRNLSDINSLAKRFLNVDKYIKKCQVFKNSDSCNIIMEKNGQKKFRLGKSEFSNGLTNFRVRKLIQSKQRRLNPIQEPKKDEPLSGERTMLYGVISSFVEKIKLPRELSVHRKPKISWRDILTGKHASTLEEGFKKRKQVNVGRPSECSVSDYKKYYDMKNEIFNLKNKRAQSNQHLERNLKSDFKNENSINRLVAGINRIDNDVAELRSKLLASKEREIIRKCKREKMEKMVKEDIRRYMSDESQSLKSKMIASAAIKFESCLGEGLRLTPDTLCSNSFEILSELDDDSNFLEDVIKGFETGESFQGETLERLEKIEEKGNEMLDKSEEIHKKGKHFHSAVRNIEVFDHREFNKHITSMKGSHLRGFIRNNSLKFTLSKMRISLKNVRSGKMLECEPNCAEFNPNSVYQRLSCHALNRIRVLYPKNDLKIHYLKEIKKYVSVSSWDLRHLMDKDFKRTTRSFE